MSDGRVVWCVVFGRDLDRVPAFLPSGWEVVDADIGSDTDGDSVIVRGVERAGWTFVDYVAPRLASGLLWASELNPELSELLEAERAQTFVRDHFVVIPVVIPVGCRRGTAR